MRGMVAYIIRQPPARNMMEFMGIDIRMMQPTTPMMQAHLAVPVRPNFLIQRPTVRKPMTEGKMFTVLTVE